MFVKTGDTVKVIAGKSRGLTGKVIKREDGKVLKPEGWTPPDIKSILRK